MFLTLLQLLLFSLPLTTGNAPSPQAFPDYVLVATARNITINCQTRYSVVFNGTSPGPPLFLRENYTTWVRVYNRIDHENLTVHWHGLSQRSSPFSDGTPAVSQWPIAPTEFFDYSITPQLGDAGSYFYHSHVGFQSNTAQGVVIVEEAQNRTPPYRYDEDLPLFIQDYFPKNDSAIEQGLVANPFRWSGEAEAISINSFSGNSSFSNASEASCTPHVINFVPGRVYRLRFISATALSLVTIGIENHPNLTIIEADGAYTKPWSTDHVQLGSGQRFSILLQAKTRSELAAAGNKTDFWIRYENRERPNNVSGYALLRYDMTNRSTNLPPHLPTTPPITLPRNVTDWAEYALEALKPAEKFPRLSEVTRTVYITMQQVIRVGSFVNGTTNGTLQWAQNNLIWQTVQRESNNSAPYLVQLYTTGQTPNYTAALQNGGWDPYSNAFPALPGEVLDIVWLSNSGPTGGWDFHPMHAHGKHYFDLGSGNGTYNATANEVRFGNYTPAPRDTTILYRYATSGQKNYTAGWRAWRIRVTEDDVGAWMMHCHILQHMIMGMQTVWVFGNSSSILSKFPTQPYVNGYLNYGGDAYGNDSYDPLVDAFPTSTAGSR
ncbi:L-ascorbate oxidase [Cladophialophora yegresii CBS 114405]|uniref:L-ascorbate oxidase n=1 Tax=Cladophialophora yegresii CBS 114405 TaxID=1182544 RepID=W9W3R5_9EURO|nr:L-ascorbate oxidase [Cladophialophora yegresii CBS 114405]EXJ62697.1 L-ascorbate oxidase [Cladophialophora yegresii CBS 114405]